MGRGRRGPSDQSKKKPKILKSTKERKYIRSGMRPIDQKSSLFLPADVVDEMKRMNPQEVANVLLSN